MMSLTCQLVIDGNRVKTSNTLMAQVRRGKIDVVVTFKLDRLARSLVHLAQIIAEFQAHCEWRILAQTIALAR